VDQRNPGSGQARRRIATPAVRAHPRGVTRTSPLLAAALAALVPAGQSGCSKGRCVAPPDWPQKLEFRLRLPDAGVEAERFSIDSAGRILWTGFPRRPAPVSLAELRKILAAFGDAPLEPWVILDAPPQADCKTVRAVRAEMDRLPLCRRGRCVEGKVWDLSDPPRGL
jgi:hypothetical protein